MPEIREGLYALNAGTVSRNALGHIDLAKLKIACEEQENWLPLVLGPAMMRPGTQFLARGKDDQPAYLLEFKKDETALALWLAYADGSLQVFDALSDTFVTRPDVGVTSVPNGDFATNIGSWTDLSEAGCSIYWESGGYLGLIGSGYNYAFARNSFTVLAPGIEHGLRVVIARGNVQVKIGTYAGGGDFWDVTLAQGEYSLAFTPYATTYIQLGAHSEYPSLVDRIVIEPPGRMTLAHPWIGGNLGKIQYDRSEDVLFVACDGFRQRRLERRNTKDMRSWAIVEYFADDGPFKTANLGVVTLAPSDTVGTCNVIASRGFWHVGHQGALFRLTHPAQEGRAILAGVNQYTPSIRVTGVDAVRVFSISITGLAGSTITLQRSLSDPGAWEDVTTYAANTATTYDDTLDNQIFWYRLGIKAGGYGGDHPSCKLVHPGSQSGIVRIVQVFDSVTANAIVLKHLGEASATPDWAEGEWSDQSGWPVAVALHDGRLFWQCSLRAQGSVSDAFHSFDDTQIGDSAPINRTTVASRPHWMASALRLLVGSTLQEIAVKSSSFDEPLTPTAFVPRTCSDHGSAQRRALVVDGQVVFVSRDARRLFVLAYDPQKADYGPTELTRLNQEICQQGIVDLAVQQQPDTRVFIVLSDGSMVVLVHEPNEKVSALVPWTMINAHIENVAVLPSAGQQDKVYAYVTRGGWMRCLEKFAIQGEVTGGTLNKCMDGHVVHTGSAVTTITGLDHLDAQSVVVWADGVPLVTQAAPLTVSGGAVTLPSAHTNVVVGMPYTAWLKTSKLAYASERGTSLAAQKRVGPIGLVMNDLGWKGVRIGRDFDHLTALPRTYRGRPLTLDEVLAEWDQAPAALNGGWGSDPRICIRVDAPYPCTVLAVAFGEQVNAGEDAPPPRER